jgi:hypothetical protein
MLSNIRFIIPMKDDDVLACKYTDNLVAMMREFLWDVNIVVNGPRTLSIIGDGSPLLLGATYLFGGDRYNPYTARNNALGALFGAYPEVTHCVLIDADCFPEEGYNEALQELLADDPEGKLLIAGRTLTKVPGINTSHFNALRHADFECYDGFTPPDHTIGANMVIGRSVWKSNGPMRDSVVSGGDGEYGIRFKANGGVVTVGENLKVHKEIRGMHLRGIIEKQLRRACCFPPDMVPPLYSVLTNLAGSAGTLSELSYRYAETADHMAYADLVDYVFKVAMHLGVLSQHMDKEIE